ncbi:MAG: MSCRAMM family adhesin SdrC, partial [Saprospiraceae bacterium]|nr:MSCRAMM family adhesin SdrC [Saprospiraceae bacterium]
MKNLQTSHHLKWLKYLSVVMLTFLGMRASAQTLTTSSCTNTYSYCTADTVKLEPQDIVTYTNFQWYSMGAPDVLINAGNAATYNVDPTRLTVPGTIYVSASGGTYILKAEYATPSGCATKNDTITINFLPVPNLATTADTICASAGETANLTTLVTDAGGPAGTMFYYNTLAEAQAGGASTVLTPTAVAPTSTRKYYFRKNTTALDATSTACYDIDSLTIDVRCLNLGNYVWYDTNNDGIRDGGESPIENVTVELFLDADGNGSLTGLEQTPIATDNTDASGLYLFEGLAPGKYFVGIPSSEIGSGGTLEFLYSSGTSISNAGATSEVSAPEPDAVATDGDDNGQYQKIGFYAGGVMTSASVTLSYTNEPLGENPDNSTIADGDDNLTVDFGFYGMSIGSNIFADVNNNGIQDGTEGGIANVMVILYAGNGTTPLDTAYTDTNGDYIFTNLPEGNYVVGVNANDSDLDGQHSSDDITTTGTPESDDLDDNGVGTSGTGVILSTVITLDAGTEPTGDAGIAGNNPLTPDVNTNNHIDFG